jgi:hypothetical protein
MLTFVNGRWGGRGIALDAPPAGKAGKERGWSRAVPKSAVQELPGSAHGDIRAARRGEKPRKAKARLGFRAAHLGFAWLFHAPEAKKSQSKPRKANRSQGKPRCFRRRGTPLWAVCMTFMARATRRVATCA